MIIESRAYARAGLLGDNKDAYEQFMILHGIIREGVCLPEDGTN